MESFVHLPSCDNSRNSERYTAKLQKVTDREDDKLPTLANVKQYYYQFNGLYQQRSKYLRITDVVITTEATRK